MSTQLANSMRDTYLATVRSELADIPWLQREELLAIVGERLGELALDESPWRALGSPIEFARQLRDGAGLPPRSHNPFVRLRASRVRTKVLIALAVLVVGVLIGALVEWPHYQPLRAEANFSATNAERVEDDLARGIDYYEYARGKYVVSGITLDNRGFAPVTVDGVVIAGSPYGPLVLRELRATSDPRLIGSVAKAPIVKHVTIQPGKTTFLFVVMKMQLKRISFEPGDTVSIGQPKLRIRVLGVHHLVEPGGGEIGILIRPKQ
jgi:hypothetical protein